MPTFPFIESTQGGRRMNLDLLKIYLNDHLAGAMGGIELTRRALSENKDNAVGEFLRTFLEELQDDRATLRGVLLALELPSDGKKQLLAWVGEKLGRFKTNGTLVSYSPLSRVVELEALCLGTEGRLSMWRTLRDLSRKEPRLARFDFARHVTRAEHHRRALERLRQEASNEAFGDKDEGSVLRFTPAERGFH